LNVHEVQSKCGGKKGHEKAKRRPEFFTVAQNFEKKKKEPGPRGERDAVSWRVNISPRKKGRDSVRLTSCKWVSGRLKKGVKGEDKSKKDLKKGKADAPRGKGRFWGGYETSNIEEYIFE